MRSALIHIEQEVIENRLSKCNTIRITTNVERYTDITGADGSLIRN